ncbi:MAG TPA: hypothetical protein VGP93_16095 [Polyangiaceae bacterium]|nr:hypothetical protein [Polyangiaceae bacterium]
MKRILVEIDDKCARDLERVAPTKKRMRAEFIRLAIQRAIDLALERGTENAYRDQPLESLTPADLLGWDEHNALARAASTSKRAHRRKGRSKRAA